MKGDKFPTFWSRSAPALPFGQSACGEHGLRSTAPKSASQAQTLTHPNNSANMEAQGGYHPP